MRVHAAALLAALICAAPAATPAAQVPDGAVVVVLPLEYPSSDPALAWLREGIAVLLSEAIESTGADVVARDERLLAYERLQLPQGAGLSRASTIKVGEAVGATVVVSGRLDVDGEEVTASLRAVRLDAGRLLPEVREQARVPDVFAMVPRLAGALLGTDAPADWAPPPSLEAFEQYINGLTAESAAEQRAALEEALEASPAYDAARLALWHLHTEQGEHQQAFTVASDVAAGGPLEQAARFSAAISLIRLQRLDDAFVALRRLQGEDALPAIANAIGVVQLRRGGTAQTGRATYYFNQATELDPADADYFFNLGYAYWLEKDASATIYWLREAVRRNPADGDAHFVLSAALQQSGAPAEAVRERELARRLSSRYEAWDARAAGGGAPVPRGLERLHDRLERASARVDTIRTTAGQREQTALARFHLDAGRRAFDRADDREALGELRRALFLSPYLGEAHLLMGRLHMRRGQAGEAVNAFKIALWSDETVPAHLALAEAYLEMDNVAGATAEVDRALVLEPRSQAARALRERISTLK